MAAIFTNVVNDAYGIVRNAMPATVTVKKRKYLQVLEEDKNSLPLVVIYPSTQSLGDEGFEGKLIREYRVGVAVMLAGDMKMQSDMDESLSLLSQIPQLLNVTSLPTATTVFDSTIDDSPAYDRDAIAKLYDHTVVEVVYLSSESRN